MPINTIKHFQLNAVFTPDATKKGKNLWMDLFRDCSSIRVNGMLLSELIKAKSEKQLDEHQFEYFLGLTQNIIAEQLFSDIKDQSDRDAAAKMFMTYLGQEGAGYLAALGLKNQLMLEQYFVGQDESHSMDLRVRPDGNISVLSNCQVFNYKKLENDMVAVQGPPEGNKALCIESYVESVFKRQSENTFSCEITGSIVGVDKNIFEKPFSFESSLNIKDIELLTQHVSEDMAKMFLEHITPLLHDYQSYLSKEYGPFSSTAEHVLPLYANLKQPLQLAEQKFAMASDMLHLIESGGKRDIEIFRSVIKKLEENQGVLEQHQKPEELTLWQKIKNLFSTFTFGGLMQLSKSKGAQVVDVIQQRLFRTIIEGVQEKDGSDDTEGEGMHL